MKSEEYLKNQKAYVEGRKAFKDNKFMTECPYDFLKEEKEFRFWITGWNDANEINRLIKRTDKNKCLMGF